MTNSSVPKCKYMQSRMYCNIMVINALKLTWQNVESRVLCLNYYIMTCLLTVGNRWQWAFWTSLGLKTFHGIHLSSCASM
jgi:hypothetical protein